jgi:hypothetical protein
MEEVLPRGILSDPNQHRRRLNKEWPTADDIFMGDNTRYN